MSLQRRLLIAGGISLLGAQRVSRAQPAATIRRVGILHVGSEAEGAALRTPFKQGMHDLGWLEGKNVAYQVPAAAGDVSRLDALARVLVEQQVDVIVAGATVATGTGRPALRHRVERKQSAAG